GPVEAEAGVIDMAMAVEGDRRIAAGVIRAATCQAGDAGDQGSEMTRIGRGAAPRRATVVRVVRARVAVAERAAGRAAATAGPATSDVVVRRRNDPARVVRIDGDRRLVLWRG